MQSPVLFLIFNRPHYAEKALAAIRKAKPSKLYIAADGPRKGKTGEKKLCRQTRNLVLSSIDWECEVKTLFQKENLGCGLGVSTGISWFFEHEEQGIILEDDIVADLSFFKFCDELLLKYKYEKNVWTISGFNYTYQGFSAFEESYSFTKISHPWGWATWKDRWRHFSLNVKNLNEDILEYYKDKRMNFFFSEVLWRMQSSNQILYIDSWFYPYHLIGIKHKALHIFPQKNMIKCIGSFGAHINNKKHPWLNTRTYKLDVMNHPKSIVNNEKLQRELNDIWSRIFLREYKQPKIPIIKNRKIYLWGTGADSQRILFLTRKYKITAFLDRQQTKEYLGYKVKQPERILNGKNRDFFIFIASTKYADEMAKTCECYGLKKGVDYWKPC